MNIQTNLMSVMRPAAVQAERLKALPEKDAYNQFVDSALGSSQYIDAGTEQAKELSRIARKVGPSLPNSESRFKLYQACFESAVSGSLAALPGGAASLVAKVVMDVLPGLDETAQNKVAVETLSAIQDKAKSTPDAMAHADFALQAAGHLSNPSRTAILQNGLGVIADLGVPFSEPVVSEPSPALSQSSVQWSEFEAKLSGLDCKVIKAGDTYPSKLEGQKVVVLMDANESGEFEQKVGTLGCTEPSKFNSSTFSLSSDGDVENSNAVLGYAVLPSSIKADSLEHVIDQLETAQRVKAYRAKETKEFIDNNLAQGHTVVAGGKYSGYDLTGRNVKILYDDETEFWQYSGTVVGTNRTSNANFKLRGDEDTQFNSNRIVQVAFLDGREPY